MKPLIIGIAGGSASGKTSISRHIQEKFSDLTRVLVIRQDDYYKDQSHKSMSERIKTNYDHPSAFDNDLLVQQVHDLMDGKPIEHEVVRAINVYFITFMILFASSVFLISFEGKDLVTNFTAVAATINNIGPGLEMVGPTSNFSVFGTFSKYVLMFDMIAGRLELFPLLILFYPPLWRDMLLKKTLKRKKLQ